MWEKPVDPISLDWSIGLKWARVRLCACPMKNQFVFNLYAVKIVIDDTLVTFSFGKCHKISIQKKKKSKCDLCLVICASVRCTCAHNFCCRCYCCCCWLSWQSEMWWHFAVGRVHMCVCGSCPMTTLYFTNYHVLCTRTKFGASLSLRTIAGRLLAHPTTIRWETRRRFRIAIALMAFCRFFFGLVTHIYFQMKMCRVKIAHINDPIQMTSICEKLDVIAVIHLEWYSPIRSGFCAPNKFWIFFLLSLSPSGKILLQVKDVSRANCKGVVAASLDEVKAKSAEKFGKSDVPNIHLDSDGTEIDDEDYFQTLEPNTELVAVFEGEQWIDVSKNGLMTFFFKQIYQIRHFHRFIMEFSMITSVRTTYQSGWIFHIQTNR